MGTYYIRQNGRNVQGPFDEDRIRGWIAQGRVRPGMEFSADGQLWIPASEHRLFAENGSAAPRIEENPAAVGSSANSLVVPWPPTPLPRGTQITYSGDRSNGVGMWSLLLHHDPPWNVHLDGWGAVLFLRHLRSSWIDFFDIFALSIGGQVGIVGDGEISLGFRVGDSESWEVAVGPTSREAADEGLVSASRIFVARPELILAMAIPDEQVSMRAEIGGRVLEAKLRPARIRSSLRAFVEYFRIEELRALSDRAVTKEISDEQYKAGTQALYAHTVG